MNKISALLCVLVLFGCTKQVKELDSSFSELKRIDKLLSERNLRLSENFRKAFAHNSNLVKSYYEKSLELHSLITETVKIISNDSILMKNKIMSGSFLHSFENALDGLKFESSLIDTLKSRHIQYWINKNLSSPLSKDEIIAITIDIRQIEWEIIDHLYQEITINDFNFNVIEPIVLESSNTVKSGEVYEAKIYLAAFDTTRYPSITINNSDLPVVNGYGIYRYKSHSKGKKTIKGNLIFPRNNWDLQTVTFEHSFNVK
jgi:hypothetical protein